MKHRILSVVFVLTLLALLATAVMAAGPVTLAGPETSPRGNKTVFTWDIDFEPEVTGTFELLIEGDSCGPIYVTDIAGDLRFAVAYLKKNLSRDMGPSAWSVSQNGDLFASGETLVPVCK